MPSNTSSTPFAYPPDLLPTAFERFKSNISRTSFVPYKFHPRNAAFEPSIDKRLYISEIVVEETEHECPTSEAYEINILQNGNIKIKVLSPLGAIWGLNSLAQLFYAHSQTTGAVYTPYAPVSIKDMPYFAHRGLQLDISRHWIPPEDVKRTLEAMSFCKMNRLHLHASDSQSWPLEIPSLPELAEKGAYGKDKVWTTGDLREIQRYGLYHGVKVYIEIDVPGHTGAIALAYPDLVVGYDHRPWNKYAMEPPSGQLKLNNPDVDTFIRRLLDDLIPRISPFSRDFHIGGDELNREVYALDPNVKSSEQEIIKPYLQRLIDHITSIVQAHGFTPYIWEDIMLQWGLDFPKETIVQTWRPGGLVKVVEQGYEALFGEYTEWYLDQGCGTFIDPDPKNPDTPVKHPYPGWAGPDKNWRRVLAYDPMKEIPKDKHHLILGGEVHLWCEMVDSVSLDFMLWPRVAAAAEMLWKGKGEVCEPTTRRLAEMRERLVAMGIKSGVVQMEWALMNEGACTL